MTSRSPRRHRLQASPGMRVERGTLYWRPSGNEPRATNLWTTDARWPSETPRAPSAHPGPRPPRLRRPGGSGADAQVGEQVVVDAAVPRVQHEVAGEREPCRRARLYPEQGAVEIAHGHRPVAAAGQGALGGDLDGGVAQYDQVGGGEALGPARQRGDVELGHRVVA